MERVMCLVGKVVSLGLLTINCLVGASELIIPVQAEYYALEGLSSLLETIALIQTNLKQELSILGVVITMYDKRIALSDVVLRELQWRCSKKTHSSFCLAGHLFRDS